MANCCDNCSNIELPVGPTGAQGPQGNPGTNGTNGTTILFNLPAEDGVNSYSNATTAAETLVSENIAANTFSVVGDAILIDFNVYLSSGTSTIDIQFDGSSLFEINLDLSSNYLQGTILLSRLNSNTVLIHATWRLTSTAAFGIANYSNTYSTVVPLTQTGIDFTNPISLEFITTGSIIGNTILTKFVVTKYKK
jgi:hypothetical protein